MHIFSKAFYSITLRYPILFFDNVHIKAHAIYRKARVSIFLRQHIPVVQLEQYQLYNSSYTSYTTGIVRVAHPVASLLKRYPYRLRMETFRCRQEEKNTFSGTTDRKFCCLSVSPTSGVTKKEEMHREIRIYGTSLFLCQMQAEAFYAGREHTTRLSSCVLGEEGFLTF